MVTKKQKERDDEIARIAAAEAAQEATQPSPQPSLSPRDRLELEQVEARKEGRELPTLKGDKIETPQAPLTEEQRGLVEEGLTKTAEREGVFNQPAIVPIISPEQEDLSVILRIAKSVLPKMDASKGLLGDRSGLEGTIFANKEPISQAEITTIAADIQEEAIAQSYTEIDNKIEETELVLNGVGLAAVAGVVGGSVIGGVVGSPVNEFIGTDGQIRSLELALSQYNEMVTIPARGIDGGLDPQVAYDKLSRMEEGILALEAQLKISGLTSVKVGLALKGRGVEARVLKLKEKIQEGRRIILQKQAQEAFREVEVTESMRFLRSLQ